MNAAQILLARNIFFAIYTKINGIAADEKIIVISLTSITEYIKRYKITALILLQIIESVFQIINNVFRCHCFL